MFAGFSHSMCDVDYLMSTLARGLCQCGFFVAQVEMRGHGDDPEEFTIVDLDTLREDIQTALAYYGEFTIDNLYCIGRGLSAALLAECLDNVRIEGIAGIAPYCIYPEHVKQCLPSIKSESVDAYEIFTGDDYVDHADFDENALAVLHALGALPYNLHGMPISKRFLDQLVCFDALPALRQNPKNNALWLFPRVDGSGEVETFVFGEHRNYPTLNRYRHALPRNPKFAKALLPVLQDWLQVSYI